MLGLPLILVITICGAEDQPAGCGSSDTDERLCCCRYGTLLKCVEYVGRQKQRNLALMAACDTPRFANTVSAVTGRVIVKAGNHFNICKMDTQTC